MCIFNSFFVKGKNDFDDFLEKIINLCQQNRILIQFGEDEKNSRINGKIQLYKQKDKDYDSKILVLSPRVLLFACAVISSYNIGLPL